MAKLRQRIPLSIQFSALALLYMAAAAALALLLSRWIGNAWISGGVVAQAASDLGLSRQALYRRLERLGIDRP